MTSTAPIAPNIMGARRPVRPVRVYRAGLMTPSPDAGAAATVTAAADALRPEGRVARIGSLFATPDLSGVVRWVLGNSMCNYNTRVREITVDANDVWCYRVTDWERASLTWDERRVINGQTDTDRVAAFWNNGMLLSAWLDAQADGADLHAEEWEILIAPEQVRSVRNVSQVRLLDAAPDWREPELRRVMREWRYAA